MVTEGSWEGIRPIEERGGFLGHVEQNISKYTTEIVKLHGIDFFVSN